MTYTLAIMLALVGVAASAIMVIAMLDAVRRQLIPTEIDPLEFKFVDNLRPPCSKCGRPKRT
jgi:hypothetical protein